MEPDIAAERVFSAHPVWLEADNGDRMFMRVHGGVPPERQADCDLTEVACAECGHNQHVLCWYGPAPYGSADEADTHPLDDAWTNSVIAWCSRHGEVGRQLILNVSYSGY